MKKDSGANRRNHLRYRDPDNSAVNLYQVLEDGSHFPIFGLVANESFSGMACVYVGDGNLKGGDELFWIEAEKIHTKLNVIRCYEIAEDVYYLALKIA